MSLEPKISMVSHSNSSSSGHIDADIKNPAGIDVTELQSITKLGEVEDLPTTNHYAGLTGRKAVDDALKFMEGKEVNYTEEEGKKVLQKIDRRILPLMFILYMVQFADKVALSYAALMGIREDCNLVGNDYSWVSSIFYAGYIAWEFPTTYFLNRLPIAKYLSANILCWGVVLTCMCAAKSYGGLLGLRFLLGAFESTITPAFVLITALWYKKDEQAKRMGLWLSANGIATIVCSAIAFGLYHVTDGALASWKIIFLLFGLLTIVIGTAFLLLLPDNQLNAKFLSEREKLIAIDRVRSNFQGVGSHTWKWYQVKEAFLDPRTYLYVLYSLFMNIPNGGVTNFGSIIIKSFGFKNERALLLNMPGGAIDFLTKITVPSIADYFNDRSLPAIGAITPPMVGGIMMSTLAVTDKVPLLIGYFFISTSGASWGLVMSMIAANTVGTTKKTVVNSLQIIGYAAGNWIGPQTFRANEAPNYPTGKKLVGILYGCALGTLILIRLVNIRENRRRDKLEAEGKIPPMLDNEEFLDRTDFEQLHLRYIL